MNIDSNVAYRQVFSSVFNMPEDRFDSDFSFEKINDWDSIIHMNLITALEEEFEVMLDTEEILHFGSFENGKRILAKHGVAIEMD